MSTPGSAAPISWARWSASACNNNGGDLILPNLEGISETLRLGLRDAELSPDEVDFVSAHATGTKMGDVIEAQAIDAVYGAHPFVTGLKSYMGHTMGSCGAIETILTLYMMQRRVHRPDAQSGGTRRTVRHDPPYPGSWRRGGSKSPPSRTSPSAASTRAS